MASLSTAGCTGFNPIWADSAADFGADSGPVIPAAGCSSITATSTAYTLGQVGDGSLSSGMALTDGNIAIVWEDVSGAKTVWLAIVTPDGSSVVEPRLIASEAISPSISSASDQQIAMTYFDRQSKSIAFRRFDRSGKEQARNSLATLVSLRAGYPKIITLGDRFAVGYYDEVTSGTFTVYTGIIAADGRVVRPFAVLPSTNQSTALVDLTTTATGFAATWTDERNGDQRIYVARLDDNGAKLPPGDLELTHGERRSTFPTITESSGNLEVCYSADYNGGTNIEIECLHVDPSNTLSAPLRVTSAPGVSSFPKVIKTPTRFMVVWGDEGFSFGKVLLRQLHLDGAPDETNLALTDFFATSGYPSVVWLGTSIGLSWFQLAQGTWSFVYQVLPCR